MDNRKKPCCACSSNLDCLKDAAQETPKADDQNGSVKEKNVDDKPDSGCICDPSCPFNQNVVSKDNKTAAPVTDVKSCTCKEEHTDDKPDGTCACSPSCRFLDADPNVDHNVDEQPEERKCICTPKCPFQTESESKEDKDVPQTEAIPVGVDQRCTCKEENADDKPDGSCACSPSCRFLDSQKPSQGADKQNEEFISCTCNQEEPEEVIEVICRCPSLATSDYSKWDCQKPS